MQISVSGKNIDVGSSLRGYVEKRLSDEVHKYLDRVTDANVVISKESHLFRTDINIHAGTHSKIAIKSKAEAGDVYASFNSAAEKVEKQLRRYKRKLKNHHKPKHSEEMSELRIVTGKKFVLAPEEEGRPEADNDQHFVIAEKATNIETLTVSEAVMKMDLADLPALLFFNKAHGNLNVVYRRADGNISWVDPTA